MKRRKALHLLGFSLVGLFLNLDVYDRPILIEEPTEEPTEEKTRLALEELLFQSLVVIDENPTRTFRFSVPESFLSSMANSSHCPNFPKAMEFDYNEVNNGYNGTGTVIDVEQGLVITAAHSVDSSRNQAMVGFIGRENQASAKVISYRPDLDLALLYIPGLARYNVQALTLARDMPSVGETIYTLGLAGSIRQNDVTLDIRNLTSGELLKVHDLGEWRDRNSIFMLHYDGDTTNHGDSGGPVVNSSGELIGINTNVNPEIGGYGTCLHGIREILKEINYHH